MGLDAAKKGAMPLDALCKRHQQGRLHGARHLVDIIRVDDKRFLKLFGSPCKARKNKDAGVRLRPEPRRIPSPQGSFHRGAE